MTELETLKKEFASGKYRVIEKDLETFLVKNAESIKKFKEQVSSKLGRECSTEMAIKWYILQIRSINPTDEIKSELDEIEKEIWYRAEQEGGRIDRSKVAEEWCMRHAPGWRDHRVLSIIFVFDQNKERYTSVLDKLWK